MRRSGGRGRLVAGRLRTVALLAAVSTAVAGCMSTPATTQAKTISDLYTVFFVAAAIVAAIVWGLITWSIFRYRRPGSSERPLPVQTHGNLALEVIWTGLPILTVLVLFGLTYFALDKVDARSPDPGVSVDVQAFQWQWRFTYPGQRVTITGQIGSPPSLIVPVGQPVHVTLTSNDVNHAFYVPAFLFKRDAIPGHPNTFDFTVMSAGVYNGQCAEFCGVFHDRMTFDVCAVSPTDFSAWAAAAQSSGSPAPPAGCAPANAPVNAPASSPASTGPAGPVSASPGASSPGLVPTPSRSGP